MGQMKKEQKAKLTVNSDDAEDLRQANAPI
jgi:hypothetical protein